MVWVERTDSAGGMWKGILIDGYLCDREKLVDIYRKVYLPRPRLPQAEGIDQLSNDQIFREAAEDFRTTYNKMIGCESPYCDLFILRFEKDKPTTLPFRYLFDEFLHDHDKDSYRQIFVVSKGCRIMNECTRSLIKTLDFRVKESEVYIDYERFVNGCEELIGMALEVYAVPCLLVEKKMKDAGFRCIIP